MEISLETAQKIAQAWPTASSLSDAMKKAGIKTNDTRKHNRYRRVAEEILGVNLPPINPEYKTNFPRTSASLTIENGAGIIFSDAHWWPLHPISAAHKLLLKAIPIIKPKFIIANGDLMDNPQISRFDKIPHQEEPDLGDEVEQVQNYLDEIYNLAHKANAKCEFYFTVGNHERLEAFVIKRARELQRLVPELGDLFPKWIISNSLTINQEFIWKHRWHGGIHAAYNNVLRAGKGIGTGHTHRLLIRPWDDYSGHREGVETGTLADPQGEQFTYTEHAPLDWQSGFVIQYWVNNKYHHELVRVIDNDRAIIQGKVVKV